MPTWLKVLLALVGVLVVTGVVGLYAAKRWFDSNQGRLKELSNKARAEGYAFGAKSDPEGCIAEARRRLGQKPDVMERIGQRAFLRWCLKSASRPPGFCEGVPRADDFLQSAKWNTTECQRRKYDDDLFCSGVMQEIQRSCWGDK